jgi:hypothetical protein
MANSVKGNCASLPEKPVAVAGMMIAYQEARQWAHRPRSSTIDLCTEKAACSATA